MSASTFCHRAAAFFFAWAALLAATGAAQERRPVLVVLHPAVEGWRREMDAWLAEHPLDLILAQTDDGRLVTAKWQTEVGASVKKFKTWNYALQVGQPVVRPSPLPGDTFSKVMVPYALHYREDAKGKVREIASGGLDCSAPNMVVAGQNFVRGMGTDLSLDVRHALSPLLLAGRLTVVPFYGGRVRNDVTSPVATVGDEAVVELHNRLPFPAKLRLRLDIALKLEDGDPFYFVGDKRPIVIAPGEKRSFAIPLAEFEEAVPKWATCLPTIVDERVEAAE
jgi:hypothetical protein